MSRPRSERGLDHSRGRQLVAGKRAADLAVRHDQDPVGQSDKFVGVARIEDDADAFPSERTYQIVDLMLGGNVDATRHVVEQQQRWPRLEPFLQQDLLLIATAQCADRRVAAASADLQGLDGAGDHAPLLAEADDAEPGAQPAERQQGKGHVERDALVEEDAFALPLERDVGDPGSDRGARSPYAERLSLERDRAAAQRRRREERAQQFGLSRPDQAAEAKNLARRQREGYSREHPALEIAHIEQRTAPRRCLRRESAARIAAGHQLDGAILGHRGAIRYLDEATVAHHHDSVAEGRDLIPSVRDEQDDAIRVAQPPDQPGQPAHLTLAERRRRLVQHHGALADRPRRRND